MDFNKIYAIDSFLSRIYKGSHFLYTAASQSSNTFLISRHSSSDMVAIFDII